MSLTPSNKAPVTPVRRIGALVLAGVLACAMLLVGGGPAAAANPGTHRLATWNMQVGSDRWSGVRTLSRTFSVVALQEVPRAAPGGSHLLGQNGNIRSYLWDIGNGQFRYLHILNQRSRNLGIVTSFFPDSVHELTGGYRSALAAVRREDGTVFASVHAASNGGRPNDAAGLIRRVAGYASNNNIANWVVLGDFNRSPQAVANDGVPQNTRIYNSGQATQLSNNELDYAASNVNTQNWHATVNPNYGSDHWPVGFSTLRASGSPRDLTIHADNSDRLLDVYNGQSANGSHVIIYHANGASNQRWRLLPMGRSAETGQPLYRIQTLSSGKCLDVHRGQKSNNGDYLNIWDCHGPNGEPDPGGSQRDTQNFTLEHPNWRFPNVTVLRNIGTRRVVNVDHNRTGDGTWLIQWPYQRNSDGTPAINETFYLHPRF
ncbi:MULTISPECIES: RICIN domain-containing protein [Streptomyces]|uniref:RICIN domain-containing protein n=1 Tax=Streptomyces griseocarneus TaxID=51201 RepID=A0ABX7RLZ4_9ACTN|nr:MULTISPECIES: RICIN domain-containing protein [Streptomyces]QSY49217.1 RICIN domain-containing protein [Streptomyces griseocarneus]